MIVYVVMGNDYPDAVFDSEAEADAYCARRKKISEADGLRIYWRHYAFKLQGVASK